LAPLLACLLLAAACGTASASEDDISNGRLGYRWTPEPPKEPTSRENQLALDVAKYVGGGILVIWFLRKMATSD
jgi:hypothetical protein